MQSPVSFFKHTVSFHVTSVPGFAFVKILIERRVYTTLAIDLFLLIVKVLCAYCNKSWKWGLEGWPRA